MTRFAIIALLAGCGGDAESAHRSAEIFMANIPGATGASCVETPDNSGYCACTVFRGERDPVSIDCGCERRCIWCAKGCKLRPEIRVTK